MVLASRPLLVFLFFKWKNNIFIYKHEEEEGEWYGLKNKEQNENNKLEKSLIRREEEKGKRGDECCDMRERERANEKFSVITLWHFLSFPFVLFFIIFHIFSTFLFHIFFLRRTNINVDDKKGPKNRDKTTKT